jgi:hypothetical protein
VFFLKVNSAENIYNDISVILGEMCPFYSIVNTWVARFRTGHLSPEDEDFVRPTQVAIPENVDAIHSTIEKYQLKRAAC